MIRALISAASLVLVGLGSVHANPGNPSNAAADGLWSWLRPHFKLAALQHPRIDAWEARYRQRATELEITLEQGKDFLYPLAEAVMAQKLPAELALVPIIESQLDPSALSPRGARGLWQIVPATAEHLSLKHTYWLDESADVVASSRAALSYLKYLQQRFGAWSLALAAYNSGEGRVAGAMRSQLQRGRPVDYWQLDLPQEAQDYVPKILALARIIRDPRGVRLPATPRAASFERVETGGPLELQQIAALAEISLGEIYRLNPQLLRWTLPAQGPYSIYLPPREAARFREALTRTPPGERRRWFRHRVKAGDTLGAIARQYNSSPNRIKEINTLRDDRLRVDQLLLVASGDKAIAYDTLRAARLGTRLPFAFRQVDEGLHQVEPGDSLWSIAQRHGTNVSHLRRLNQLPAGQTLHAGQVLRVGVTDGRKRLYYEVQSGDVLSRIAQRYGLRVSDIQRWNALETTLLRPGQVLELRLDRRSTPS